ncbi:MAG TPA: non-ribosomal peptide synthetase [Candidatus Dormibacteraeota bacterium]|nr:non-ribosomal peptide synthetase [Candidatus Dormibacteraeota bacterium]
MESIFADQPRLVPLSSERREFPQDLLVPELIAAQAVATPSAIAVTYGNLSLTYKELDVRANELAHILRSLGVGLDEVVGLCLNRSLAMIVGALGILRAGAAYLPLDPTYPTERLTFFLKDAQVEIVLADQRIAETLDVPPERVVHLDCEGRAGLGGTSGPLLTAANADNLAYVIYTSGSTGQPKGVEITHGGLLNLVYWHRSSFNVSPKDRASQLSTLAFDAAAWELWPYLTTGSSLHLPHNVAVGEPEAVRDWLTSQEITIAFVPTPLAERVITLDWDQSIALRLMLTGADTLHRYPPQTLRFRLVNNYGPTECTVVATSGTVLPDEHPDRVPTIGRPISNTQIFILNKNMQQVATGEPGEIYIGGAGLARGYRKRAVLTAERFVANPFSVEPGARLYKTGDLARSLPDGQIAFLGRIDNQVKIRGFRIEPAEIEKVLDEHPGVRASSVVAREAEGGEKRLIAYFVPADKIQVKYTELRNFIGSRLPAYMMPAKFVKLDALPLNPSGKLDHAVLPSPNGENTLSDETFVEPRTITEKRVAEILGGLLELERVGAEDNFFQLGGHSLLGTQLMARLRRAFNVDISLRGLFEAPTVAKLSAHVETLLVAKVGAMSEEEVQHFLEIASSGQESEPE